MRVFPTVFAALLAAVSVVIAGRTTSATCESYTLKCSTSKTAWAGKTTKVKAALYSKANRITKDVEVGLWWYDGDFSYKKSKSTPKGYTAETYSDELSYNGMTIKKNTMIQAILSVDKCASTTTTIYAFADFPGCGYFEVECPLIDVKYKKGYSCSPTPAPTMAPTPVTALGCNASCERVFQWMEAACRSPLVLESSACIDVAKEETYICATMCSNTSSAFVPLPPVNPFLGLPATSATMHANAESSDSTYFPGPGSGSVSVLKNLNIPAAFALVLMGEDGLLQCVATNIVNETPYVYLIDPNTLAVLASMKLLYSRNALAGGIYSFIDRHDRLVLVNAKGYLQRIAHTEITDGTWKLNVVEQVNIGYNGVVGLVPDYQGRVWFATGQGTNGTGAVVGFYSPYESVSTFDISTFTLPPGEQVANSISSCPYGVAVVSTSALYLFKAELGQVTQIWRKTYDNGPSRKPGQLSHGSGTTPVFFGPRDGFEYVTITDNAAPVENILVYRSLTGELTGSTSMGPLIGTEDAPMASGKGIIISSTYGYPYPPGSASGPSIPPSANFSGGILRADIGPDGNLTTVWVNDVLSSAVPRLSIGDSLVYTFKINATTGWYSFVSIDANTGAELSSTPIGDSALVNTLQMTGLITKTGILYWGVAHGLLRIQADLSNPN